MGSVLFPGDPQESLQLTTPWASSCKKNIFLGEHTKLLHTYNDHPSFLRKKFFRWSLCDKYFINFGFCGGILETSLPGDRGWITGHLEATLIRCSTENTRGWLVKHQPWFSITLILLPVPVRTGHKETEVLRPVKAAYIAAWGDTEQLHDSVTEIRLALTQLEPKDFRYDILPTHLRWKCFGSCAAHRCSSKSFKEVHVMLKWSLGLS